VNVFQPGYGFYDQRRSERNRGVSRMLRMIWGRDIVETMTDSDKSPVLLTLHNVLSRHQQRWWEGWSRDIYINIQETMTDSDKSPVLLTLHNALSRHQQRWWEGWSRDIYIHK
jgi:hypothetical protein